ncbi:MAG: hypothetical protein WAK95_19765 [Desulfobacterales bacterium]
MLIDFIKTGRAVLELVVKHVGSLYVTSPVVDEVNEIDDENELVALGLIIIEPEIEGAYVAGSRSGPLSFEDWLCLLTAKRHAQTESEPPRLNRNPGRRASKRRIGKDVAGGVSRRRQGRNDKNPVGPILRSGPSGFWVK